MQCSIELKKTKIEKDFWLSKGKFNYAKDKYLFYVVKVNYEIDPDALWLAMVFGDFREVSLEPCNICMRIVSTPEGRKMSIASRGQSVFSDQELGSTKDLNRNEIVNQPGLIEWIIKLYDELLNLDKDIRNTIGESGIRDLRK